MFHCGAAVESRRNDPAGAELAFDGERRAVAQPGDYLRGPARSGFPIWRDGEKTFDRNGAEKSGSLSEKDAEDRMIRGFEIGRLVQAVDEQLRSAGQRHGKRTCSGPVELLVVPTDLALRAEEDAQAAPIVDEFFQ